MSNLCMSVFLVAVCGTSFTVALYPQWAQFYEEDNCFGKFDYTLDSVSNFSSLPIRNNPVSITWKGAWTFVTQDVNTGQIGTITGLNDGGSCFLHLNNNNYTFIAADKHLGVDLEESELALYSGIWSGSKLLVNADEYRLASPTTFRSYAFAGIVPYTVFSGINFDGTSQCLEVKSFTDVEHGINGDFGDMVVGSIRKGCPNKQNQSPRNFDDVDSKQKLVNTIEHTVRIDPKSGIYVSNMHGASTWVMTSS